MVNYWPLKWKLWPPNCQIKALLLNLQPVCPSAFAVALQPPLGKPKQSNDESYGLASSPCVASQQDEDTLSIAASGNFFTDDEAREKEELDGGPSSSRDDESGLSTLKQAIQLAVSRLGLDAAPAEAVALFCQTSPSTIVFQGSTL